MAAKKRTKSSKIIFGYVTTRNKNEARKIGRALVKKRLAGCVNIIPNMFSSYQWQGKIEESAETVLIIKSVESRRKNLVAEIKKLHSYTVPCILFFRSEGGNLDYIRWLKQGCD